MPLCMTSNESVDRRSRTDRDEGLLLEFSQCLFTIGFGGDRGMSGHVRETGVWCERAVTCQVFLNLETRSQAQNVACKLFKPRNVASSQYPAIQLHHGARTQTA